MACHTAYYTHVILVMKQLQCRRCISIMMQLFLFLSSIAFTMLACLEMQSCVAVHVHVYIWKWLHAY